MKIKEIEYSELRTSNYNNYRVGMRVELEDGEDERTVMESLKEKVRAELARAMAEGSPIGQYYDREIERLRNQKEILEKEKKVLIGEIIARIRQRFNEIWR